MEKESNWYSEIKVWAQSLDEKWDKAKASGMEFSAFATSALLGHSFHTNFNLDKEIKNILEDSSYPEQLNPNSNFGDPPITLYFSKDKTFYLDLYVWNEAHTSIHQHNFEGAFTVLQGLSIESDYVFKASQDLGPSKIGKLEKKALRKVAAGEVRPIHPHDKMVHRVLHLSNPTVSLVLRTHKTFNTNQQYNYDFDVLASASHPPGDVVGKMRVLHWYLNQGHTPTYPMVQDLLPYSRLYMMLTHFQTGHSLLKKIALLQFETDLMLGLSRQLMFHRILPELKTAEEKMLFIAYEFNDESWKEWVETNFGISKEDAEMKLKAALAACASMDEASKRSSLLSKLF